MSIFRNFRDAPSRRRRDRRGQRSIADRAAISGATATTPSATEKTGGARNRIPRVGVGTPDTRDTIGIAHRRRTQ